MRPRGGRGPKRALARVIPMFGRVAMSSAIDQFPPSKYEVACCASRVDSEGRYPIGWCSPECERRPG